MRTSCLWALAGVLIGAVAAAAPASAAPPALDTPQRVTAYPGNGAVLVTYTTVPNATGYNLYRRAATETADKAVLVNQAPTTYGWVVDAGANNAGLTNGTNYLYSVKAILQDGKEGPASADVLARPQAPLAGALFTYDIGTMNPSTVTLSPDNKVLTIKASGGELWANNDSGTFVGTAVIGDYSVSAKLLDRPQIQSDGQIHAKAGVIIREDIAQFSRNAYVFCSNSRDPAVRYEGRNGPNDDQNFSDGSGVDTDVPYPRWMKLTRSGTTITAFQSTDGTNWTQTIDGDAGVQDFAYLNPVTYGGIECTALQDGTYVTANFDATYGLTGIKYE